MAVFNPVPYYKTGGNYQVYYQDAVNKRKRVTPLNQLPNGLPIYLIAHFTESPELDTRSYLWSPSDGRAVSAHYLTGVYADMGIQPVIYKYGSEQDDCMYTQGFGLIGDFLTYNHGSQWDANTVTLNNVVVNYDLNDLAVGYEIEANPTATGMPSSWLLACVTSHMAEILRYWKSLGREMVLLGHKHVDPEKQDPQLDWMAFDHQVKAQI